MYFMFELEVLFVGIVQKIRKLWQDHDNLCIRIATMQEKMRDGQILLEPLD